MQPHIVAVLEVEVGGEAYEFGLAQPEIAELARTASIQSKSPHAGRSLLEILWEELDAVMERLMTDEKPDFRGSGVPYEERYELIRAWGEERGQAQGLAYAIAVLTNPYAPSVPAIRQEAVARWKSKG